jgi:hypothetical protein
MNTGKIIDHYRRAARKLDLSSPKSPDFKFIRAELRAFLDVDKESRSVELADLYESCNGGRAGRQGWFRKGPFALYWLSLKVENEKAVIEYLRGHLGLGPRRLIKRGPNQSIRVLDAFLGILEDEDPDLMDALANAWGNPPQLLEAYSDRAVLENQLIEKRLNPDAGHSRKKVSQAGDLEGWLGGVRKLPFSEIEGTLEEIDAISPDDKAGIKARLKELRQKNKLAGKVFEFLMEKKTAGQEKVSQRELERRFTKRISDLAPVLEGMAFDRVIIWDRKGRVLALNGYNPRDQRKFVWLAASTWPRSPFDPYLETGKAHSVRDFRDYVVEEWVKTGAARFL